MNEVTLAVIATGVSVIGLIYTMFRNLKSDIQNFQRLPKLFHDLAITEESGVNSNNYKGVVNFEYLAEFERKC